MADPRQEAIERLRKEFDRDVWGRTGEDVLSVLDQLAEAQTENERLQMTLDEANDIAFAEHATVVRLTNNLEREKVLREALKAIVRYSKTTAGPHMAPYMAEIAVRALAQHPDTPSSQI